eukprot:GHVU01089577.1.p1 GENE.GHVU01089577.1~~GHVU01089577.1.p1  ORF type:complete len:128 (+),score=12.02 GHVU01089577.1:69-452(+)
MTKLMKTLLAIWVATFTLCSALYSETSPVQVVDHKTLVEMEQEGEPMLVEFYAPWCGHCQTMVPEYEKAARNLSKHVKVVATEDSSAVAAYRIRGFPTIELFNGNDWQMYYGPRKSAHMAEFVMQHL